MNDTEKREALDILKGIAKEAVALAVKEQAEASEKALADYEKKFDEYDKKIATASFADGIAEAKKAENEVFNKFMRKGFDAIPQDVVRTNVSEDGGFLIPTEISKQIMTYAQEKNPMRELASQITIGTDSYAVFDETGDCDGGWVGEEETRSAGGNPKFGQTTIYTREVYAQPKATQKEIDDSIINIEEWLALRAGRIIAKKENAGFFNGEGPKQPEGLLKYAKVADASWARGKFGFLKTGSTSAITADNLIDIQDALKDEYQLNASWLMAQSTFTALRKLKDGSSGANRYLLWTPELIGGRLVNTLLGSPVVKCSEVDAIGSGKYPVAYGDFKQGYLIVDRLGIRLIRDNLTAKPYVQFYTTKRVGGGVMNSEAVKFLQTAT